MMLTMEDVVNSSVKTEVISRDQQEFAAPNNKRRENLVLYCGNTSVRHHCNANQIIIATWCLQWRMW